MGSRGPKNGSIRDYFQSSQTPSMKPAIAPLAARAKPGLLAKSQVIKSSDDEESDSDSSLDDITELFQTTSSASRHIADTSTTPARHGRMSKNTKLHTSPLAVLPKYRFDLQALASEAKKHEAAEARALRMKALEKEEEEEMRNGLISTSRLLKSVIEDKEDGNVDKVMRAVQRTEAIHTDKQWYFFERLATDTPRTSSPFPVQQNDNSWQGELLDPDNREATIVSGFARDMVTLGECLPDEILLWMLDEVCFDVSDDLRQAYSDILFASSDQVSRLVRPEVVKRMFSNLGGSRSAVDIEHKLQPKLADPHVYDGREWAGLRLVIRFLGDISHHIHAATSSYVLSLLSRLCADSMVLDNVALMCAVQESVTRVSESIEEEVWEAQCQVICTSVYTTIQQATLRCQVLQCLPASSQRMHDIRRRLALAFVFEDLGKATSPAHQTIDLWEITKLLDGPRFKISEATNYGELAALISILDIAIDNGLCVDVDMGEPSASQDFDADVDALAARIKALWSSVNDSGASFLSRMDAKEVMEGVRHRLIYAVRSRPKPKHSVFDSIPDGSEQVRKQSAWMSRYLGKPEKADELGG
ncbi:MAG: hypothetical protein M1818_006799 [Claussenomyces sp. TS43310]|nr:MAG: hypothetical protein M1818_006799 [Claussenomyces sp. TS43310]